MIDPRTLVIGVAAACAGALLWTLALRAWRSGRARRRMARALRGERAAERLLVARGFVIEGRQVAACARLRVDGASLEIPIRVDLVVRRGGRRYVAEVKTGALAPRLDHAPTRRQLLEYRVALGADGVLLVDVEAGAVREVVFDGLARPRRRSALALAAVFGAGLAAGAAIALVLGRG